eukprot:m.1346670 g.1346670  ORF g.1346670 m.1346670 type:complete len:637 (-) comp24907_c0_seq3:2685-4595(-)
MVECKKRRVEPVDACDTVNDWAPCAPQHPCGVRPGSIFASVVDKHSGAITVLDRSEGLGRLAQLSDDILLSILALLDAPTLGRLAGVSKVVFAFVYDDALWKRHVEALLISRKSVAKEELLRFYDSWRTTYIVLSSSLKTKHNGMRAPPSSMCRNVHIPVGDRHPLFRKSVFYSDLLHKRWMLGTTALDNPAWCAFDNVDRRSGLSRSEFIRDYERASRPVIVTDVVPQWPSFKAWNRKEMLEQCGDVEFKVSGQQMTLREFFHYSEMNTDERPLYLFDSKFAKKCPEFAEGYTPPKYFDDDFFRLLASSHGDRNSREQSGALSASRPDHRWFIIGPRRSGSSFHVDPNGTCAWSAMFAGRKKWILYPPHVLPPGVEIDTSPEGDGGFITTTSLVDWMLTYYPHIHDVPEDERPLECVTKAGELIFVPSGWWHCVINLDESVAITHNVVTEHNLISAIDLLAEPVHCPQGSCRGDVMGDVPLWVAMGGETSSSQTVSGDATSDVVAQVEAAAAPETQSSGTKVSSDGGARGAVAGRPDTRSADGCEASNSECACDRAKQRLLKRFRAALEHEKPGLEAKLRQEAQALGSMHSGVSALDTSSTTPSTTLWDRMRMVPPSATNTNTAVTPGTAFSFGF